MGIRTLQIGCQMKFTDSTGSHEAHWVCPAVDESISQGARPSEMFSLLLDLILLQLSN